MKKNLLDFVKHNKQFLDSKICDSTVNQLNKLEKSYWQEHFFHNSLTRENKKKVGDQELSTLYSNEVSTKEILMKEIWNSLSNYINDLKFKWFDGWNGYSELRFNVNSTIEGYTKVKEDDPSISFDSETSFDKLIITDPREFFNFRYDNEKDNKNLSSIDSENVLRIRIGSKDFKGRSAGVTHVSVRVPENFDYNKFQSELPNIKIALTNSTEVDRVIKEVEALVTKCTGEAPTVFMDTKLNTKIDYKQDIYKQDIVINFIKSIEEKIGKEETKKIFIDIINNL